MPGVRGLDSLPLAVGQEGCAAFQLAAGGGPEVAAAVARAVVEAGLGLWELTPVGQSLEEVFVQLTGSQAPARAPGGPGMRALGAIFRRELAAYFHSAIAYVLWVGFSLLTGYFFYSGTMYYAIASLQAGQDPMSLPLNLHDLLVAPLLANMSILMMLIAPLLTMRLLSEEKRSGTLELLLSYPLSGLAVVLGKFLAALTMLALILLPTLLHMLILAWLGPLYWPGLLLGYLGLLLLGGCFMALGLLASACTENQIVAAVAAFAGLLLLWVMRWSGSLAGSSWGPVLERLSLSLHFEKLAKGLLDSADLVYFLLFMGFFLLASLRVLEAKRWKS